MVRHCTSATISSGWHDFLQRTVIAAAVAAATCIASDTAQALTFTKVVDNFTKIPGTETFFDFNSSDVPAISGDVIAFATKDQSVWTKLLPDGVLVKVIDTSTPIPGRTDTFFNQFYGDSVQISGNKVVVVGLPCAGCNSGVGIYTVPQNGGAVTKLVDNNDFLPGSTTEKFGHFPLDFKAEGDTIAFQNAERVFSVPLAGGRVRALAGPQDSGFTPPQPYCCLFIQPDLEPGEPVVVRAGNVFGRASIQTVARNGSPTSFRVIADGSTRAPKTGSDYHFDDFSLIQPVIDQTIVFRGRSISPTNPFVVDGIYSRGSGFRRLVDNKMRVPGGRGRFQSVNGFDQIVADAGLVVFRGIDEDGRLGLYAVPQMGGAVTKVIAAGDPIGDSFTVLAVSMGRGALSGNRLVFLVGYDNFQGAGIYSTDLSGLVGATKSGAN